MKFLKKTLIISMVICVLCSVCLLPVSADVVDGVWDDPVGNIDPFSVSVEYYNHLGDPYYEDVSLDGYYRVPIAYLGSLTGDLYSGDVDAIVYNKQKNKYHSVKSIYESGNYYYVPGGVYTGTRQMTINIITDQNDGNYIYVKDYPLGLNSSYFGSTSFDVYYVGSPPAPDITEPLLGVWSSIFAWVTGSLTLATSAFFADGELTLLGALAIMVLSIGLAWLVVGIIQKFLRLRG